MSDVTFEGGYSSCQECRLAERARIREGAIERVMLECFLTHYYGPDGLTAFSRLSGEERKEYRLEAARIVDAVLGVRP